MEIKEYNPSGDFEKHILWQYNNAPNINKLVELKQNWYKVNQSDYWLNFVNNVINIHNANEYGLALWGIFLQLPRHYLVNGEWLTLGLEQYRKLILARLSMLKMRGTIPEINKLLKFLFKDYGKAFVVDNLDMSLTYRFDFILTDLQVAVLKAIDILPRPAGVNIKVLALDNFVFGFDGSGQPFDQARFAEYLEF